MKILIHDERTDALEFLMGSVAGYGYRAGIAKDDAEILSMLADESYDVVLTSRNYEALRLKLFPRLNSSSVCIIGIKDRQNGSEAVDPAVDVHLSRPFMASELRQILKSRGKARPVYDEKDRQNEGALKPARRRQGGGG